MAASVVRHGVRARSAWAVSTCNRVAVSARGPAFALDGGRRVAAVAAALRPRAVRGWSRSLSGGGGVTVASSIPEITLAELEERIADAVAEPGACHHQCGWYLVWFCFPLCRFFFRAHTHRLALQPGRLLCSLTCANRARWRRAVLCQRPRTCHVRTASARSCRCV